MYQWLQSKFEWNRWLNLWIRLSYMDLLLISHLRNRSWSQIRLCSCSAPQTQSGSSARGATHQLTEVTSQQHVTATWNGSGERCVSRQDDFLQERESGLRYFSRMLYIKTWKTVPLKWFFWFEVLQTVVHQYGAIALSLLPFHVQARLSFLGFSFFR